MYEDLLFEANSFFNSNLDEVEQISGLTNTRIQSISVYLFCFKNAYEVISEKLLMCVRGSREICFQINPYEMHLLNINNC